jgi:hypothetical protein
VEQSMHADEQTLGWSWFSAEPPSSLTDDDLTKAVQACFAGRNGDVVIEHLRTLYLDRRVPPSASDAELRHVEGQRAAIAYLLRLARPRG